MIGFFHRGTHAPIQDLACQCDLKEDVFKTMLEGGEKLFPPPHHQSDREEKQKKKEEERKEGGEQNTQVPFITPAVLRVYK